MFRFILLLNLAQLAAFGASAYAAPNFTTISLDIPTSPSAGVQIVDSRYQSYSIEFSYMLDYAGNKSFVMAKPRPWT